MYILTSSKLEKRDKIHGIIYLLDCQAVVSALMRHAVNVDDEQLMDDLRILESSLHTSRFRNALSVSFSYTICRPFIIFNY